MATRDNDDVEVDERDVEDEGPKQTVSVMPQDFGQEGFGPKFPSGTNTVEAALGGATADMTDEQIAVLHGEGAEGTTRQQKSIEQGEA